MADRKKPTKFPAAKIDILHVYLKNPKIELKMVAELLKHKVEINSYDKENHTPLHLAVKNPNSDHEVVQFLLENGADVHVYNQNEQCNALHYATRNLNVNFKVIETLLEYQANINAKNYKNHCNALIYATQNPNMSNEVLELLCKHGANVNARNYIDCWYTPLHYAVLNPNFDCKSVEILLAYGANIHCDCAYGDTPLHVALVNDAAKFEVVKVLLHSETKYYHCLRKALDSYCTSSNSRLGCLEILKYIVVEVIGKNPRCINDFYTCRSVVGEEYFNLISGHSQKNVFAAHVKECVSEINHMKICYALCGFDEQRSIYDSIFPGTSYTKVSSNVDGESYIENLLGVWFDDSIYPIYSDVIQLNIKKRDVVNMLTTFRICVRSFEEDGRVMFLDNASTLILVKYLNVNDLMNLVGAFYDVNKDPVLLQCNGYISLKRRKFN